MSYKYYIEHEADGYYSYNKELFEEELPYLEKVLNTLRKNKILLRIGDSVYGNNAVYYVQEICFYDTHVTFWVDEYINRNRHTTED